MDILSDILETIQLRGALYFHTDFSPPWGAAVPAHTRAARFHLVVQGHCHIALPSGATVSLDAGDFILIPGGRAHILSDSPGVTAPPLEKILEEAGYSGQGVLAFGEGDDQASTKMICGHFDFAPGADHRVLRALPEYVLVPACDRATRPWLDQPLRLLISHVFSTQAGSAAAVSRLSEVVLIEAIRTGIEGAPQLNRLLEGFNDPQIGRALALMHSEWARSWTVEELASEVGMSRSIFAERFKAITGCGPMTYLAEWRLQKAKALLTNSAVSIGEVARLSGYRSASAFTRAFTSGFEQSPSAFRRGTELD